MAQSVIGALRVNLGLNSAAFIKGLSESQSRLKRFGATVAKGAAVAGAAMAGAAAGIGLAVRGVVNEADAMRKAARAIGIPTEELSRLKYAADLSGVSFESLQNGIKRLSANMQDALAGTGEGKRAFEALGISVANADGTLKTSSAIMREVSDRFAAMPDGAEKTALAMRLFGESGAMMINMLNGGSDALGNLMAEADGFGKVFTDEMGEQAELFNDNIARLTGSVGSLTASLTKALLPTLVKISDFAVGVAKGFRSLPESFQSGIAIAGALTAALTALAVPLAAIVISFGAISAPVLLAVAAITAITAAVIAFWPEIVQAVHAAKDFYVSIWSNIYHGLKDIGVKIYQVGADIVNGLIGGITSKISELTSTVTNMAAGAVNSIKSFLGIRSPSRVMHEVGVNMMQGLGNGMESMRSVVDDISNSIVNGLTNAFMAVIDGTKDMKDALADFGREMLRMLANKAIQQLLMAMIGGPAAAGVGIGMTLPAFANGGSFKVGGTGGIDSQIVAFRASPSESVHVTKPGQMLAGAGSSVVEVRLSGELEGRILAKAEGQAVRIVRASAPGMAEAGARKAQQSFGSQPSRWQR